MAEYECMTYNTLSADRRKTEARQIVTNKERNIR